jgi:hypothetical protein
MLRDRESIDLLLRSILVWPDANWMGRGEGDGNRHGEVEELRR